MSETMTKLIVLVTNKQITTKYVKNKTQKKVAIYSI